MNKGILGDLLILGPALICATMMFFAIADQPYNYYVTTRWVTLACCAFFCFVFKDATEARGAVVAHAIVGFVFNPIFVLSAPKENWRVFDAVGGFTLICAAAWVLSVGRTMIQKRVIAGLVIAVFVAFGVQSRDPLGSNVKPVHTSRPTRAR